VSRNGFEVCSSRCWAGFVDSGAMLVMMTFRFVGFSMSPRVALRWRRPLGPVLFSKVTGGGETVSTMTGAGIGSIGVGIGGVGLGVGILPGTLFGPAWGTIWGTIAGTGMASAGAIVSLSGIILVESTLRGGIDSGVWPPSEVTQEPILDLGEPWGLG
jgi:hypothetical protein